MEYTKITDDIFRTTTAYKDIYTTVCVIKTAQGALLFDAASWDEDFGQSIRPFLDALGIGSDELKYIFISHNHTDHAGGLKELLKHFPNVCVISGSESLRETYPETKFLCPGDGEMILDVLQVVHIPGHTQDSAAILDTRTSTLLSGDCLQLWGIFGSGKWGANIRFPVEHAKAIRKLRGLKIEQILAAHDYHPLGHLYHGDETSRALDACLEPLRAVAELLRQDPSASDAELCERYNAVKGRPTLGTHVVTAMREALGSGSDLF